MPSILLLWSFLYCLSQQKHCSVQLLQLNSKSWSQVTQAEYIYIINITLPSRAIFYTVKAAYTIKFRLQETNTYPPETAFTLDPLIKLISIEQKSAARRKSNHQRGAAYQPQRSVRHFIKKQNNRICIGLRRLLYKYNSRQINWRERANTKTAAAALIRGRGASENQTL